MSWKHPPVLLAGLPILAAGLVMLSGPAVEDSPVAAASSPPALVSGGEEASGAPSALVPSATETAPQLVNLPYDGDFTFVRIQFGSRRGGFGRGFGRGGGAPWAHDFPYADNNFLKILDEVSLVGPNIEGSNVISADDPLLHRYPIAYISEPGQWSPTQGDIDNLSSYLQRGGFLILDDFRGPGEWARVEAIMQAIIPDHYFSELTIEESIFHAFFEVESLDFSPPTFRQYKPYFMGIHENNDPGRRLLVIANYNNDIGDYWEYSDMGYYPIDLSNEAYKVGVNYVIYALTR